jgi:hypothetical protein
LALKSAWWTDYIQILKWYIITHIGIGIGIRVYDNDLEFGIAIVSWTMKMDIPMLFIPESYIFNKNY